VVTKGGDFDGLEKLLKVVRFYTREIIEWGRSTGRLNFSIRSSSAIQKDVSMVHLSCTELIHSRRVSTGD